MDERNEILNKVRRLDKGLVFTTTVLERGITIKDVQVIVYNADHILFNRDTLIQISGRVGRHKSYCSGDIIFICKRKNKTIKAAIRALKKCNE
jgi:competence protein ComFA